MDEPNSEFENLGGLLERRQHERRRQGPPTHVHWRRRLPEGEVEVVNLNIFGIGRATFVNLSSFVPLLDIIEIGLLYC